jgi:hypothetical protein
MPLAGTVLVSRVTPYHESVMSSLASGQEKRKLVKVVE